LIIDLETTPLTSMTGFDVCVIGAGAAGLTVAVELARKKRRVLVLEGGGIKVWEREGWALNKSDIIGLPFAGAQIGRFRTLGGSTSQWTGQVIELDDIDFETRPWVPGSGWPIRKSDLAAGYQRALELEGLHASLGEDDDVWAHACTRQPDLGDNLDLSFSRICPERKFARIFEDILASEHILVALHANACELAFAEDGETVTSVRCRTLTGIEARFTADRFVLCLGGIESSRFLLNQHHAPWNRSGLVGRHFQDHLHYPAAATIKLRDGSNPCYGPHRINLGGYYYVPRIKLSPSAQERHGVLNVTGMVDYGDGIFAALRTAATLWRGPVSVIKPRDLAYLAVRAPSVLWYLLRSKTNPGFVLPALKLKLTVVCEQPPLSESRITLSPERDALGMYRSSIDWRISREEMETVRRYVQTVQRIFAQHRIGHVIPDTDLYTDKFVHKCTDYFHHIGGTRMATLPGHGVVDPNLRLHGTRNAYLCSTSVFPSSGSANPTHTLVALAVRLAWHLQERSSQGSAALLTSGGMSL
jgi:choline dehydrogenase-like flavoprotein